MKGDIACSSGSINTQNQFVKLSASIDTCSNQKQNRTKKQKTFAVVLIWLAFPHFVKAKAFQSRNHGHLNVVLMLRVVVIRAPFRNFVSDSTPVLDSQDHRDHSNHSKIPASNISNACPCDAIKLKF